MQCENCNTVHDGNYGSGRFCCVRCARQFSTQSGKHNRKSAAQILIIHSEKKRMDGRKLFRALCEIGRDYRCEIKDCKIGAEWNGKRLTLHIDHVNGIPYDNRPENVRFICPNCHSQQLTSGFKRKHTKESRRKISIAMSATHERRRRMLCRSTGVDA